MVQLAIDTSGRGGAIAILRGEAVLDDVPLPEEGRTAATLAPALDRAIRWCRGQRLEPGLISVAAGPGSFTGLRIGVTTAKTLSYATRWPLVAVDSLAAIAATVFAQTAGDPEPHVDRLLVGVNAYRRQVYTGQFCRASLMAPLDAVARPEQRGRFDPLDRPEVRVVSAAAWRETLSEMPAETALAGEAKIYGEAAAGLIPRRTSDAVGVGLLALRAALSGRWADPMALVPRYLKPSAAEEKAAR